MIDETKRLAIEQLERVSKNLGVIGETVDYTELAIEALGQEECEDVISRQAVIEFLKGFEILHNHDELRNNLIYGIMNISPVKPQDQKIGVGHQIKHKLKDEDFNKDFIFYECSCCSDVLEFRCNYCSNCGVKFEGEKDKNEISN